MIKEWINKSIIRQFRKSETKLHELNYLFWECTRRCNLHCRHCGSDCSQESNTPDMPIEDFIKATDTIPRPLADNFTVVITGGEPLMRKDLEECGKEIRKRGMNWSMVTNGHLYTTERHFSLLDAGIGALTISLDGLEDSHTWMRNNTDSFERVMHAIELAANSPRINFDVVTCVNKRNLKELEQIADLLESKLVKSWRLFTIIPIGRATLDPEQHLNGDEFKHLMEFIALQRTTRKFLKIQFSCEGYVGKYETQVRSGHYFCRAGINIGSILIDGSISACPNIDRNLAQGNIYRDNFYSVWENKFEPFRDRHWTNCGECQGCNQYKDCQGNGLHNWHGEKTNVLVCHYKKTL